MDEKSIFQRIGDAVADYAPGIAGVLAATGVGTPAAAAVGAVGTLAKALGLGKEASPDDVFRAVTTDPEIALKAKIADQEFELKKRDQDIEEIKIMLADVQSARMRQVESEKTTGKRDVNLYVLAWVIMGGFLGLMLAMVIGQYFFGKTLTDDPLLTLMFGSLSTDAGMVVGYFFGSSKSSADKTEIIARKNP